MHYITGLTFLCATAAAGALGSMPSITLPWGTFTATSLDDGIYTFENVRFGKAPVGALRFSASVFPDPVAAPEHVFPETSGATCIQVNTTECGKNPMLPECIGYPSKPQDEDCLFLDIYVPETAIEKAKSKNATTPVVVWLFGGAFVFGSKDPLLNGEYSSPFYSGRGAVTSAGHDLIFVAANYRLGAFGWLAGPSMQYQGYPNAGLSDQRLVFEFVQRYIGLVGGDSSQVSAWGESAGASSILHHLISKNPPSFHRAAVNSPAFEWQWDPDTMESTFQHFAALAGLPGGNVSVNDLRSIDIDTAIRANQQLYCDTAAVTGLFPLGPALDGKYITQLPPVALKSGNVKPLDSLIVSHVYDEAADFIPAAFNWTATPNETTFQTFLEDFIPEPSLKYVTRNITSQYPLSTYQNNQTLRVKDVIRDAVFTCNTRFLYDAYHITTPTYMLQYSIGRSFHAAVHASDVLPLFWHDAWALFAFLRANDCINLWDAAAVDEVLKHYSRYYQSYYTAHARTGDPNRYPLGELQLHWPIATDDGERVKDVLDFGLPLARTIADEVNTARACEFWANAAFEVQDGILGRRTGWGGEKQRVVTDEL